VSWASCLDLSTLEKKMRDCSILASTIAEKNNVREN
jgi:hypothetical protein